MFAKLGEFIVRAWPAVLIAWLAAVVSASIIAPPLEKVAETEEFAFLPSDSESHIAESLFRDAFPNGYCPSRIVIIGRREDGITADDEAFFDDKTDESEFPITDPSRKFELREHLTQFAADEVAEGKNSPPIISRIRSFADPHTGRFLRSEDKKAILLVVELTTEFMDGRNHEPLAKIENLLSDKAFAEQKPKNLSIFLSGEATVGRDMLDAARNSAKATEWLTVILVLTLLGAIYRSPFMAIIPLVIVVVAVKLSMSLLILFATQKWVVLFQGIEVYVAVLMYGAGVDYCLFLVARYKEEIDAGVSYDEAASNSVAKVGAAIAASAGTVICGIGMMTFAKFGKFHDAGIAISFGLIIVLIASLTLTPALLRLAGKWAFWPQMRTERVTAGWVPSSSLWTRISEIHMLQNSWEVVGQALIKFPMRIWLASIVLMIPFALVGAINYTHLSYGLLSDLSVDSPSVIGARVLRSHFSPGTTGAISILIHNDSVDFTDEETGLLWIDQITKSLNDDKQKLELDQIRSVAYPFGADDTRLLDMSAGLVRKKTMQEAKEYYISSAKAATHVARLEITATVDPFGRDSLTHLTRLQQEIRQRLPAELKSGTEVLASGSTASIRDLKKVTDGDQVRIDVLVVTSVFLILLVLLRKFALCCYLIVSVLFSYLVALGATYAFFALTDSQFAGLDWKVPMFLFTILIAVGEDYNIFLMTRIEEEQKEYGPVRGIIEALSKTGRIISSCGIIMAGTFASLCAGSLKGMIQLGFALAFGVLLDTFVVRPILVPAYLVLVSSGRFGKFGEYLGGPKVEEVPAQEAAAVGVPPSAQ